MLLITFKNKIIKLEPEMESEPAPFNRFRLRPKSTGSATLVLMQCIGIGKCAQ